MIWPWQRTRHWLEGVAEVRAQARTVRELPVLAVRDGVVFPDEVTELTVGRPASVAALREAESTNRLVWIVAQRDVELDEPTPAQLYEVGCIALVERIEWLLDIADVRAHGLLRARAVEHHDGRVAVTVLDEVACADGELDARTVDILRVLAPKLVADRGALDKPRAEALAVAAPGPGRLADLIVATIGLAVHQAQQVLEMLNDKQRVELVLDPSRHEHADAKAMELVALRQQLMRQLRGQ